jgi:hypothetical protein
MSQNIYLTEKKRLLMILIEKSKIKGWKILKIRWNIKNNGINIFYFYFYNYMKFYRIDEYIIEFAKDIIKNVLPLEYWEKICLELNISCEVAFVDDIGNQHTSKRYGIGNTNMKLLLMYEHFMPNAVVDKSVVNCCEINRNIKLSYLIDNIMRKICL